MNSTQFCKQNVWSPSGPSSSEHCQAISTEKALTLLEENLQLSAAHSSQCAGHGRVKQLLLSLALHFVFIILRDERRYLFYLEYAPGKFPYCSCLTAVPCHHCLTLAWSPLVLPLSLTPIQSPEIMERAQKLSVMNKQDTFVTTSADGDYINCGLFLLQGHSWELHIYLG